MQFIKRIILLGGDIFILYLSLSLTLLIRYGLPFSFPRLSDHLFPFSLIFIFWLLFFLIADLYNLQLLRMPNLLVRHTTHAISFAFSLSVLLFYLFGSFFALTPKTNLLLFTAITSLLFLGWRFLALHLFSLGQMRILFAGSSPVFSDLSQHIKKNPQLGYELVGHSEASSSLLKIAKHKRAELIVLGSGDLDFFRQLLLPTRVYFLSARDFYESLFGRVAADLIDHEWILHVTSRRYAFFETLKRLGDFFLGLVLAIFFLPLGFLIVLIILLTSRGPVIYSQKRTGQGGMPFTLYKFRTMTHGADGPLWTEKNDDRVTWFGKFLRFTHLDELPQLWNILRGDIAFVGPRPERIELAEKYRALPYYDLRHLIKPGITGWAQIAFPPSTSLEEARAKLSYDLHYLKYRSFFVDVILLLKTIRLFISLRFFRP